MDRDPLATMEDFDRARGDANIDFRPNKGVRNRVEEVMDLDMIVEVDPRAAIPRTPNPQPAVR